MRTRSSTLHTLGLSPLLSILFYLITLAARDSQLRLPLQGPLNLLGPLPVPQLGHCETVSWEVTGSRDCSHLLGLPPFIICRCLRCLEGSCVVFLQEGKSGCSVLLERLSHECALPDVGPGTNEALLESCECALAARATRAV